MHQCRPDTNLTNIALDDGGVEMGITASPGSEELLQNLLCVHCRTQEPHPEHLDAPVVSCYQHHGQSFEKASSCLSSVQSDHEPQEGRMMSITKPLL